MALRKCEQAEEVEVMSEKEMDRCQTDGSAEEAKEKGNGGKGRTRKQRRSWKQRNTAGEKLARDEVQENMRMMKSWEEEKNHREDVRGLSNRRKRNRKVQGRGGGSPEVMSKVERQSSRGSCDKWGKRGEAVWDRWQVMTSRKDTRRQQRKEGEREVREEERARRQKEERSQEAREEERSAQEAREEERSAQEAREEERSAQEAREEERRAQEPRVEERGERR